MFWKKKDKVVLKLTTKDEATNIFMDGFRFGFDKAWQMMPEVRDDIRKKIESQAIDETLKRLNGNLLPKTK